jgi:hypothetical protein
VTSAGGDPVHLPRMLQLTHANTVALSPDAVACLERDGFLLLDDVLEAATVARLARRLDELLAQEGDRAGREFRDLVAPADRRGAAHLGDLLSKDPLFERCLTAPRVLGAVRVLLGDRVRLHAMNSRSPRPGDGQQELHTHLGLCNTLWLLDGMTLDNGPTRVVPGSHRRTDDDEPDRDWRLPYDGERLITAPAGSVLVLDPAVWHGGTANRIGAPRRVVTTAYSAPDRAPQY